MSEPAESVIRNYLAALERSDVNELLSYFRDDAVFIDGPRGTHEGIDAIRTRNAIDGDAFQPQHRGKGTRRESGTVVTERVDTFEIQGKSFDLEVAAVIEVDGDNRIKRWRDYYDLRSLEDRMAAAFGLPVDRFNSHGARPQPVSQEISRGHRHLDEEPHHVFRSWPVAERGVVVHAARRRRKPVRRMRPPMGRPVIQSQQPKAVHPMWQRAAMTTPPTPAPGWYPDPSRYRWAGVLDRPGVGRTAGAAEEVAQAEERSADRPWCLRRAGDHRQPGTEGG